MSGLQTSNIFAALGSGKSGKKKSSKSKEEGGKEPKSKHSKAEEQKRLEAAIFGGQSTVSNWADELDEDDDFGGGLAPLPADWSTVSEGKQQASGRSDVYSSIGLMVRDMRPIPACTDATYACGDQALS